MDYVSTNVLGRGEILLLLLCYYFNFKHSNNIIFTTCIVQVKLFKGVADFTRTKVVAL
jgi:hypothetical protein